MPTLARRLAPLSFVLLLAVLAALTLVACGGRDAADVAVSVPPDPREDAPLALTLAGEAGAPAEAWATIARAGADCRRGVAASSPAPVDGRFRLAGEAQVEAAGPYVACALVRRDGEVTVAARRAVRVRPTRGQVALAMPSTADMWLVDALVAGSVEAPAELVLVRASTPAACDLAAPRFGAQDVEESLVVGPGRFRETFQADVGLDAGTQAWCAVLRDDRRVLAVARRSVTVPRA